MPRTNNSSEGWNNAFTCSMNVSHPVIYRFMDKIMQELTLSKKKISDCEAGAERPAVGTKKQQRARGRIAKAVKNYNKRLEDKENERESEDVDDENDSDEDDEDDDDSATPLLAAPSQAESIQANPQMMLLNLIAINSKFTKK